MFGNEYQRMSESNELSDRLKKYHKIFGNRDRKTKHTIDDKVNTICGKIVEKIHTNNHENQKLFQDIKNRYNEYNKSNNNEGMNTIGNFKLTLMSLKNI